MLEEYNSIRSPNDAALKWKQIKNIMLNDLKRLKKQNNGQKFLTSHEWMIAAMSSLEK